MRIRGVVAAFAVGLSAVGCAGAGRSAVTADSRTGTATSSESVHTPGLLTTSSVESDAPDAPVVSAQGVRGQFVVECSLDRLLADDPIVKPGRSGAAHLHAFFGATEVGAHTTYQQLLASSTTCDQQLDTASYWAPVLVDVEDQPVEPIRSIAYYRVAAGVDNSAVQAYPPGLMMVAGDAHADVAQPLSAVAWGCGVSSDLQPKPPDCRLADNLRMSVTFQDCWNGSDVAPPDPSRPSTHVAYSHGGVCPDGFGVHLPQLQFVVEYPPVDPSVVSLSSGSLYSAHADFWNGWQQDKLKREVRHCLQRDLPCRIARSARSIG